LTDAGLKLIDSGITAETPGETSEPGSSGSGDRSGELERGTRNGSELAGATGSRVRFSKNSASTRKSSGRKAATSGGITAAISFRNDGNPPDGEAEAEADFTIAEKGLAAPKALGSDSGLGISSSAWHLGQTTTAPTLVGATARS
jgi:hypothetical protein